MAGRTKRTLPVQDSMRDENLGKATLIDRLAEHAAIFPNKASYVFLPDNANAQVISFRDLEQRVQAVAASLMNRFDHGERVMIFLPTGLDFVVAFLACLTAGLIAVPAYPPRRKRSDERLRAILADAEPAMAVGDQDNGALQELVRGQIRSMTVSSVSELENDGSTVSGTRTPRRNRVAFLQYTSGSTAQPRGVIVTHANLMFNARQLQVSFGHTPDSLVVSWLPLFHDMGLVGCVLQSLYVGFTSVLLSPVSFILAPARWLQAASDFRATTIGGPNFAYDLCVKNISAEQKQRLDLTSLQVAFNGSEPVRPQTIERFITAFSSCGFSPQAFFPCYGLAESTLFVSGGPAGSGPRTMWTCGHSLEHHRIRHTPETNREAHSLAGSGQVAEGTRVDIVDPQTRCICPQDTVGEIWIASESVADGYWNRVSETATTFGAVLADRLDGRRYLRTGDTGIIDGGQLFIVGRIKDVIIVRGRKIYPQDVEALIEGLLGRVHANYVAAFGVESDDGEGLAVLIEADRKLNRLLQREGAVVSLQPASSDEVIGLVGAIREAVSEAFDIALSALYFVKLGSFPRTSSGKVQRTACKAAVATTAPEIIFNWSLGVNARSRNNSQHRPASQEI
jgi:acyl-CoA synthetase (AMP-forming)/AMP-acid ligase II